jgi:type IV secretory pathway TrbL component
MIDISLALTIAEQIITGIIKVAPAIEQGIVDEQPYIQAIAGMLNGSNATQAQVDALLAQIETDSALFQQPLPPDTGDTTT